MDLKTVTLLSNLSFPIESEVHVARHLVNFPKRLLSKLSITTQKNVVMYDGSQFSTTFISDPNQLIQIIIENGTLSRFHNVNYSQLELEFTFPEKRYPEGIGVSKYKSNKNVLSLVLILHRNKRKWEVTTSFPGKVSVR